MGRARPASIISHWDQMIQGMQQSSNEFYAAIDLQLAPHMLADTKTERVNIAEGGIFSAKREYLQVRRNEHVFHICAAPFGNGFFVSWWLGEIESGLFATLAEIPFIGVVVRLFRSAVKPITYFRVDTALMFQSVTHGAVLAALDEVTTAKGLKALSELERKPVMREFFSRIGG